MALFFGLAGVAIDSSYVGGPRVATGMGRTAIAMFSDDRRAICDIFQGGFNDDVGGGSKNSCGGNGQTAIFTAKETIIIVFVLRKRVETEQDEHWID